MESYDFIYVFGIAFAVIIDLMPLQLGARLEQLAREVVGPPRRLARRRVRGRHLAAQRPLGRRSLRLRQGTGAQRATAL